MTQWAKGVRQQGSNIFTSTNQPVKNGRPKKLYTLVKEQGYSKDDMKAAFKELSFSTLPELKKMKSDASKPIIVRIVANQFVAALRDTDWLKIKDILEYVIGKPQQQLDVKVNSQHTTTLSIQHAQQQLADPTQYTTQELEFALKFGLIQMNSLAGIKDADIIEE